MTPIVRRRATGLARILIGALTVAACGGSGTPAGSGDAAAGDDDGGLVIDPSASIAIPADLVIQLAEFPSARQIGLFAAEANGHFERELLSVLPMEGDHTTDPMEMLGDPDSVQIYIGPAVAALRANAAGADLVNIGQLLARAGDRIVVRADAGIGTIADLAGQTVAILPGPAGEVVLPALVTGGLDATDVELVAQPFDPATFLAGEVAIAHVRLEDEWAQLLETVDPTTGALTDPAALVVIDLSTPELATLQDGVWVHAAWLADNEDVAIRFLRALAEGWIDCRDALGDCPQLAVESGAVRPLGHQRWVLAHTAALMWPAPDGIGVLDPESWTRTGMLALAAGVIDAAPPATSDRDDLMAAALATMDDLDTTWAGFVPAEVTITADGEAPSEGV